VRASSRNIENEVGVVGEVRENSLHHHQLLETLQTGLAREEDLGHAALRELREERVPASDHLHGHFSGGSYCT